MYGQLCRKDTPIRAARKQKDVIGRHIMDLNANAASASRHSEAN